MLTLLFNISQSAFKKDTVFTTLILAFTVIWFYFFKTALDKTDWWIENILVIIFFIFLIAGRRKLSLSNTAVLFILLFLLLHIYGARMAYTKNELGEYFKNTLQLDRNPYDRIVHFSFGFLLLFPFMTIIKKQLSIGSGLLLLLANMCILCLASIFELIEWGVAAFTDKVTGETYVATQGDPWDAQKDIMMAVAGALFFSFIISYSKKTFNKLY